MSKIAGEEEGGRRRESAGRGEAGGRKRGGSHSASNYQVPCLVCRLSRLSLGKSLAQGFASSAGVSTHTYRVSVFDV